MSSKQEERGVASALGSIPTVHNQRAFSATVTIAGTGIGDITVNDVKNTLASQHTLIDANEMDQMYVHRMRAYGSAGGYLSLSGYPHRQYLNIFNDGTIANSVGTMINCYNQFDEQTSTEFRSGSLFSKYDFGINGSTRPELTWDWPEAEVLNNPFTILSAFAFPQPGATNSIPLNNTCKLCTVQSTNGSGDALYIIQFDVTVRNSEFIPITQSLGAAGFGEKNVLVDNYKPSNDPKRRQEEGDKAQEMANKKRKIESVKALTMPVLDSH